MKCPDCGKLIAPSFSLHWCEPKTNNKEKAMTRNGYKQVEIVIKNYPAGKAIWVVEHNGQRSADTGNPTGGQWHGPYKTQKEAEAAAIGMWKPTSKKSERGSN